MADDAVYDAIKDFLATAGNVAVLADPVTLVVPPIRFENEPFEKPDTAPWIDMSLSGVLYSQESIGASAQADNRWDESGRLWLPVFVSAGTGASRARQLAKMLANIFRGLTLLNDTLEFMDSFIGEGGAAQETGNWFEIPLMIEWRRSDA